MASREIIQPLQCFIPYCEPELKRVRYNYEKDIKSIKWREEKMSNKSTQSQDAYFLGKKFKNLYLTRQEARCMVCLLRGSSIKLAAYTLGLSARTVEYYVNNIKKKLGCRTKAELIGLIIETPFFNEENIKSLDL